MNNETHEVKVLPRVGTIGVMEKAYRSNNNYYPGLTVTLAGLLFIAVVCLLANPVGVNAQSESNSEPVIEGFNLFRYDDDLSWELSGETAGREDGYLSVLGFEFVVKQSDGNGTELLYALSGEEIRLKSNGDMKVAIIPGELEIDIKDGLSGTAGNARYNFTTGEVTGGDIELVRTDGDEKTSLAGENFRYSYDNKSLIVTGGFRAEIVSSERELIEVSGGRITLAEDGDIIMTGELTASTDSGWWLTATRMLRSSDGAGLVCSGSVTAKKDQVRIEGESLTYSETGEKVEIKDARMTIAGN